MLDVRRCWRHRPLIGFSTKGCYFLRLLAVSGSRARTLPFRIPSELLQAVRVVVSGPLFFLLPLPWPVVAAVPSSVAARKAACSRDASLAHRVSLAAVGAEHVGTHLMIST